MPNIIWGLSVEQWTLIVATATLLGVFAQIVLANRELSVVRTDLRNNELQLKEFMRRPAYHLTLSHISNIRNVRERWVRVDGGTQRREEWSLLCSRIMFTMRVFGTRQSNGYLVELLIPAKDDALIML